MSSIISVFDLFSFIKMTDWYGRFILFQMLDVIYREETLINVIKSVTKNGRSILLTAFLAVILIYLFSIVGYMFFQTDFIMEVEPLPGIEHHVEGMYIVVWK